MSQPYIMGYQAPVTIGRIQQFLKGELNVAGIVLFFQDCIEAGLIPTLAMQFGERFCDTAIHYIEQGLCYDPDSGKAMH